MDKPDDAQNMDDVLREALRLLKECQEAETQFKKIMDEAQKRGISFEGKGVPKHTKTTTIPDAGLFCPDDEDNRLVDSCDIEVEDTITDATIEDFLK